MKPGSVVRTAAPSPAVVVRSSGTPLVSCLIVTYGTGPIIVDCLGALDRTLTNRGVPFEVVIVDNLHPVAPHRSWRRLQSSTSGVRVLRSPINLGFAGGNNLAATHARGDLIALLNPDLIVSDGWFAPLREALGEASIAAPVLVDERGDVLEAGQQLTSDAHTVAITEPPPPGSISHPLYASAACWLLERVEFERLGRLDEGFHPAYYEDVDFGLRAGRDGRGTAVVGASRVVHLHGASTADPAPPSLERQHTRLVGRWDALLATLPERA